MEKNIEPPEVLPLPSELRNQVYRLLLSSTYRLPPSDTTTTPTTSKADLAILRVSKTTHEEAMSVLYSESTFKFGIDSKDTSEPTTLLPKPAGMIQKVVVEISASFKELEEEGMRQMIRSTIGVFRGVDRKRESMLVKIDAAHTVLFGNPPEYLFKVLGNLLGFRVLVVELSLSPLTNAPILPLECTKSNGEMVVRSIHSIVGNRCGLAEVRNAECNEDFSYAQSLEFRPLERAADNLMMKAMGMKELAKDTIRRAEEMEGDAKMLKALV